MIINKVSDLNQRVGYLIQAREFLIRFNLIHREEFLFNPVSNFFKKSVSDSNQGSFWFKLESIWFKPESLCHPESIWFKPEYLIQTREYLIQTREFMIQSRE